MTILVAIHRAYDRAMDCVAGYAIGQTLGLSKKQLREIVTEYEAHIRDLNAKLRYAQTCAAEAGLVACGKEREIAELKIVVAGLKNKVVEDQAANDKLRAMHQEMIRIMSCL